MECILLAYTHNRVIYRAILTLKSVVMLALYSIQGLDHVDYNPICDASLCHGVSRGVQRFRSLFRRQRRQRRNSR